MKRRSIAAVLITTLVLALTGCLRYNSIYYIQSDGTVSGQIYTALKEGYQNNSDPYKGTGAAEIAAAFPGSTITDVTSAPWYGYMIQFSNAPLSSFSAVPSEPWQIQITKSGNVYKILGENTDSTTDDTRNAINSNDGYIYLQIGYPGALKDGGNSVNSGTSSGAGWSEWDLVNMTGTPHGEGYGGLIFIDPGLFHFDPIPLTPGPLATPASTPAPVVTVVVTPSPDAPSPSASPSNSATPSPTLTTIAGPDSGDSGGGIPLAVWIVLGALVLGLVGVGSYMLAQRGRGAAVVAAGAGAGAGAAGAAGSAGAAAGSGDVADTMEMKAVDPTPTDPTPAPTPKELPPDVV